MILFFVGIRILPQRPNVKWPSTVYGVNKARILQSRPLVLPPAALPASPAPLAVQPHWTSGTTFLPTAEMEDVVFPLPGTFFWATFLHQ